MYRIKMNPYPGSLAVESHLLSSTPKTLETHKPNTRLKHTGSEVMLDGTRAKWGFPFHVLACLPMGDNLMMLEANKKKLTDFTFHLYVFAFLSSSSFSSCLRLVSRLQLL